MKIIQGGPFPVPIESDEHHCKPIGGKRRPKSGFVMEGLDVAATPA